MHERGCRLDASFVSNRFELLDTTKHFIQVEVPVWIDVWAALKDEAWAAFVVRSVAEVDGMRTHRHSWHAFVTCHTTVLEVHKWLVDTL